MGIQCQEGWWGQSLRRHSNVRRSLGSDCGHKWEGEKRERGREWGGEGRENRRGEGSGEERGERGEREIEGRRGGRQGETGGEGGEGGKGKVRGGEREGSKGGGKLSLHVICQLCNYLLVTTCR